MLRVTAFIDSPVSCLLNAAISAGIQKLEEELGASIENGDASSTGTLTERHRFDCESQTTNQQLVVGQQAKDQNTEEDISQEDVADATSSTTLELGTGDDQSVEDRTGTPLDIAIANTKSVEINEDYLVPEDRTVEKTEDNDNGSLRDASSVQNNKDIIRTVDTDEISRTVDTNDVIRSVDTSDMSGTVDTSDTSRTVDTIDMTRTVDTSDMSRTVVTSDMSRTVDTSDVSRTVDTSDMIRTVDSIDMSRTVDTIDTSRTVDTSDMSKTVDTSDTSKTVDTSDMTSSVDSSADTSGTVDTNDITETEQEIK